MYLHKLRCAPSGQSSLLGASFLASKTATKFKGDFSDFSVIVSAAAVAMRVESLHSFSARGKDKHSGLCLFGVVAGEPTAVTTARTHYVVIISQCCNDRLTTTKDGMRYNVPRFVMCR